MKTTMAMVADVARLWPECQSTKLWRVRLREIKRNGLCNSPTRRCLGRGGLTLAELLVVLTILAVMTLVAVQAMQPVVGQARYEATERQLEKIRGAIVDRQTDNVPDVSGYIADTGNLPSGLIDLLVIPSGMQGHALRSYDTGGVGAVQLASGWNGPYLQLGVGATGLRDGWGNEFLFDSSSSPGSLIITSHGADGEPGTATSGYDGDVSLVIQPQDYQTAAGILRIRHADRSEPDLTGTSHTLTLFVISNAGSSDGVASVSQAAHWDANTPYIDTPLPSMPVGRMIVRAVYDDGTIRHPTAPIVINLTPRQSVDRTLKLPSSALQTQGDAADPDDPGDSEEN